MNSIELVAHIDQRGLSVMLDWGVVQGETWIDGKGLEIGDSHRIIFEREAGQLVEFEVC